MSDPPTESWKQRVLSAVAAVPAGRVASYGEIARRTGHPGRARQVGWVLSALTTDDEAPWWRIINAAGCISPRPSAPEQARRLRLEGVAVSDEGMLPSPPWAE